MKESDYFKRNSFFAIVFSMTVLGSLLLVNIPGFAMDTANAEEQEKRIVAYYTNWANYGRGFDVLDLDVSNLTHILYAFGDFCWEGKDNRNSSPDKNACFDLKTKKKVPNGTVISSDPWADFDNVSLVKLTPEEEESWELDYYGNLGAFHQLKQDNPHLKVLYSLGGWTQSKHFSKVAYDEKARQTFVQSAVDFIRTYDLDGIDIDWKFPVGGGAEGNSNRPEDKQNHTLLLQELRDELDKYATEDGKIYELSAASGANPDYLENNEMAEIGEILDFINIMAYDFYVAEEGVNGHNAALFNDFTSGVEGMALYNAKTAIEGHLKAGIPAEKLVMGMPMYGRSWNDCDGEFTKCSGASKGTWEDGVVDYDHIISKMGDVDAKYTRHWNDIAKVPFLTSDTGEFISFDDVESIKLKAKFAKELNLGGAMFWELSQDRNNDLITTAANVFNDVVIDKELTVDSKEAIRVEKNQLITGKTTDEAIDFEVKFPVNLPHNMKFNVYSGEEKTKDLPEGYIFAGSNLDFDLQLPDEAKDMSVIFELRLAIAADAENPAIHCYDEDKELWVKVNDGGKVENGMISMQINHLSNFAVLGEGSVTKPVNGVGLVAGGFVIVLLIGLVSLLVVRQRENREDW